MPTTSQPDDNTNDGEDGPSGVVIAIAVLVPVVTIAVIICLVYVWYRRRYPVRMVFGKDFATFSNPSYTKRSSTLTLVRDPNDVDFERDIENGVRLTGVYYNKALDISDETQYQPTSGNSTLLRAMADDRKTFDESPTLSNRKPSPSVSLGGLSLVVEKRNVSKDSLAEVSQLHGENEKRNDDDEKGSEVKVKSQTSDNTVPPVTDGGEGNIQGIKEDKDNESKTSSIGIDNTSEKNDAEVDEEAQEKRSHKDSDFSETENMHQDSDVDSDNDSTGEYVITPDNEGDGGSQKSIHGDNTSVTSEEGGDESETMVAVTIDDLPQIGARLSRSSSMNTEEGDLEDVAREDHSDSDKSNKNEDTDRIILMSYEAIENGIHVVNTPPSDGKYVSDLEKTSSENSSVVNSDEDESFEIIQEDSGDGNLVRPKKEQELTSPEDNEVNNFNINEIKQERDERETRFPYKQTDESERDINESRTSVIVAPYSNAKVTDNENDDRTSPASVQSSISSVEADFPVIKINPRPTRFSPPPIVSPPQPSSVSHPLPSRQPRIQESPSPPPTLPSPQPASSDQSTSSIQTNPQESLPLHGLSTVSSCQAKHSPVLLSVHGIESEKRPSSPPPPISPPSESQPANASPVQARKSSIPSLIYESEVIQSTSSAPLRKTSLPVTTPSDSSTIASIISPNLVSNAEPVASINIPQSAKISIPDVSELKTFPDLSKKSPNTLVSHEQPVQAASFTKPTPNTNFSEPSKSSVSFTSKDNQTQLSTSEEKAVKSTPSSKKTSFSDPPKSKPFQMPSKSSRKSPSLPSALKPRLKGLSLTSLLSRATSSKEAPLSDNQDASVFTNTPPVPDELPSLPASPPPLTATSSLPSDRNQLLNIPPSPTSSLDSVSEDPSILTAREILPHADVSPELPASPPPLSLAFDPLPEDPPALPGSPPPLTTSTVAFSENSEILVVPPALPAAPPPLPSIPPPLSSSFTFLSASPTPYIPFDSRPDPIDASNLISPFQSNNSEFIVDNPSETRADDDAPFRNDGRSTLSKLDASIDSGSSFEIIEHDISPRENQAMRKIKLTRESSSNSSSSEDNSFEATDSFKNVPPQGRRESITLDNPLYSASNFNMRLQFATEDDSVTEGLGRSGRKKSISMDNPAFDSTNEAIANTETSLDKYQTIEVTNIREEDVSEDSEDEKPRKRVLKVDMISDSSEDSDFNADDASVHSGVPSDDSVDSDISDEGELNATHAYILNEDD